MSNNMANDYKENYGTGWISLYRSIKNHWIFKNEKWLKWWLIMLFEVNHKPNKITIGYEVVDIAVGSSANSLRTWGKMFDCTPKTVKSFFKLLEKDKMISYKIVGKGKQSTTLINIENYTQYQGVKETQEHHKGITKGSQGDHKLPTNNNDNNYNNDNNSVYTPEKFLQRWSDARKYYLKKPTYITKLKYNELNIFKELTKNYSQKQFEKAMQGLFENSTFPQTTLNPSHFLENFEQYLTAGISGEKLFKGNKKGSNDKTGMI